MQNRNPASLIMPGKPDSGSASAAASTELKRIEFTIRDADGDVLQGSSFVSDCSELPYALMQAMEDFLDAYDNQLRLPLTIQLRPNPDQPTC